MTTWFTSDLHLGHRRIIELSYRPFASVEEMNRQLVDRWNDRVQPEDVVYVLGDVVMGNVRQMLPVVQQLKGTKLLVPGNHDGCWPGHKRWRREARRYIEVGGFTAVLGTEVDAGVVSLALGNEPVLMCHFPYRGDHTAEVRYPEWRPADNGAVLLHGHVHGAWRRNGRQINVGVDAWDYAPVSLRELCELRTSRSEVVAAR